MFSMVSKSNPTVSFQNIVSFVTGAAKLLVPGRVTATTSIPQGATTNPIDNEHLLGQPDVQQISVCLNALGVIELEEKSKEVWCEHIHWIRALRLSDDCHSYNVQLRIHPSNVQKLILQAIRPIQAGEELLLWFSEDILAILQVVFLTPANIQGQKKYVCTRCSALYESPNPLKLHITLQCGKNSISSLWEKLNQVLKSSNLNALQCKDSFKFTLSPEPALNRQKNAMDLTIAHVKPEINNEKNLYRPYQSAFKPFRKEDEPTSLWNSNQVVNKLLPAGDKAQIECLVSSLGKSKQGHICLYCGKCYSRKYGLKIHIRTHTGYKPLKCKHCLRPFGDPSNLNKHVRLHAEGNTPYKCDLCGKILVRRRDLERHLKSRHLIENHPSIDILADTRDKTINKQDTS